MDGKWKRVGIVVGAFCVGVIVAVIGAVLLNQRLSSREETPQSSASGGLGGASAGNVSDPLQGPQYDMPAAPMERKTVVPDDVKSTWRAVTIRVENKRDRSVKNYEVPIGGELTVPDSHLVVKVGEFLPDLVIQGALLTSASNNPNNPAVHVTVSEGGKEIFKGWLMALFPAIHPFQHERFGLTLKEALRS